MIMSMTGFASRELDVRAVGRLYLEIRSTNHKFLEVIFHLPEGFLSFEDRLKKEIESRIKRGRLTCVVTLTPSQRPQVAINIKLLRSYIRAIERIRGQVRVKDGLTVDTLVKLPGVLSLEQPQVSRQRVWPAFRTLVRGAVDDLLAARRKEGRALQRHLTARGKSLRDKLEAIRARFRGVVRAKLAAMKTDEERSAFLKDSDISEEIERLGFHIRNFLSRISKGGAIGKELDFMAQEMQREANTMGAKSCDTQISARVIQIKSQVEKIREQVQNIE